MGTVVGASVEGLFVPIAISWKMVFVYDHSFFSFLSKVTGRIKGERQHAAEKICLFLRRGQS